MNVEDFDCAASVRAFVADIGLIEPRAGVGVDVGVEPQAECKAMVAALRRLAVQGAMLASLVEEAAAAGTGMGRVGPSADWWERALAAIECGPLSPEVCARICGGGTVRHAAATDGASSRVSAARPVRLLR